MKKKSVFDRVMRVLSVFFFSFLLVIFITSCCVALFASVVQKSMGTVFTDSDIADAAKLTLLNALILGCVFALVDLLRKRYTVDRPVRMITEATERMIKGDFDVRITPAVKVLSDGTFNEIIDSINQMAQELSGVETLRTDFVANVSHEMKTPLAAIQNYGRLLQSPELSDEKRLEYARAVTDTSRRLSEMMANVLRLSRLENQQIYPDPAVYDLGEQLCECLLQYENVWESRGINIETELAEGINVCADRELLSIVWNNLLSNAFKFTECGGTVRLSLSAEDGYARVTVADTGCGIESDVGEHIFERFYQGDTSHSTEGNGLGLALVKRVIDITEGEIFVESTPRVGTSFTVRIKMGVEL